MLSRFSFIWLFVTLWSVAHQAPLSMESLQARILEWIAMPSSRESSWPRDQTHISMSPVLAGRFFTTSDTWEGFYFLPAFYYFFLAYFSPFFKYLEVET